MLALTRLLSLFGLILLAMAQGLPSAQAAASDAFASLATDNYADIEKGVVAVAESGAPTTEAVLNALIDNRLLYRPADRVLFYKDMRGAFFNGLTGEAVTPAPTGLRPVRLNNRVRRAVEAAIGTLTLMSPEASKRRQAAEAVFRSRDAATLPVLAKAIAAEQNAGVKQALIQAQAAIFLTADGIADSDRIQAVDIVASRGDQDALSMLRQVAGRGSPVLKLAADTAITAIERRLAIAGMVQNVWYGLSLGSVLLLAAIGLAITFGVMGIINMAHGEMVMIGAYTTFVVQEICRTRFPGLFDWSLPVALPLAFLVAGGIGALIERLVIRHLYGRPLETLLATWGISLILQQAVRSLFGPSNREVGAPSYMAGAFDVMGVTITYGRLWIVVFSLCVFLGLIAVLKLTPFGLRMRAVTQNRRMASAMGIRTPRIDMLAFALGSGIAGIAGVALSQIDNVSPNLGQSYIIDSFMVVVFGGVGNLWGTFVSALTLGVANKFLEPYAGAVLGKILLLVFLILFIQKRPRGLFALKGRSVEA